jgi:hypothetical protein
MRRTGDPQTGNCAVVGCWVQRWARLRVPDVLRDDQLGQANSGVTELGNTPLGESGCRPGGWSDDNIERTRPSATGGYGRSLHQTRRIGHRHRVRAARYCRPPPILSSP